MQAHTQSTTIPERTIWSYVIQLACAIKKVHDAGQAVRMIDVTKVLLTGKNRWASLPSPFVPHKLTLNFCY